MKIELGGWTIRNFEQADVEALVRHADNPRVAASLKDRFPSPYTAADARYWLDHVQRQHPQTHFAIAGDEGLIGGIGLERQDDVHRYSAELGYWLGEPYWGRGIATRAVEAIAAWGFEQLGLVRIFAGVFETNPASARVLEKAGFELEARLRNHVYKRGELRDELLYVRLR